MEVETRESLINAATEFLKAVSFELDQHTSHKGQIVVEETKVTLLTPSHIQFARYGRRPGKKPPLDKILEWVSRKGIIFDGKTERGTAFAVQKSIGQKGTIGFTPNAPNFLEQTLTKNMDAYNQEVSKVMVTVTDKILQEEYKKIMPETMEIKI